MGTLPLTPCYSGATEVMEVLQWWSEGQVRGNGEGVNSVAWECVN